MVPLGAARPEVLQPEGFCGASCVFKGRFYVRVNSDLAADDDRLVG